VLRLNALSCLWVLLDVQLGMVQQSLSGVIFGPQKFLHLSFQFFFSFARNKDISVKQLLQAIDLDSIFQLPLSSPTYDEMLNLQQYLNLISYNPDLDDQWIFIWGNQNYTSSRYYRMVFQNF
jgi:hypothetical protein